MGGVSSSNCSDRLWVPLVFSLVEPSLPELSGAISHLWWFRRTWQVQAGLQPRTRSRPVVQTPCLSSCTLVARTHCLQF